jgi:hypothetical protein
MNCRKAEHLIFAERDGALDEIQRAALVSHVRQCVCCSRLQSGLAETVDGWRAAHRDIRIPDAELEWQNLRRQIRGGVGRANVAPRKAVAWYAVPLAAAAAIAAAVFINEGARHSSLATQTKPSVARATPSAENASTVVFVDEKSGWTFVVAADDTHRG